MSAVSAKINTNITSAAAIYRHGAHHRNISAHLNASKTLLSRPAPQHFSKSLSHTATSTRSLTTIICAAGPKAPPRDVTTKEEQVSPSRVRLTLTVPAEQCKKAYRTTLKQWNDKIACTGYRKGKAPDAVLIKQLGGEQRVNNTVLTDLIEDVMGPALEATPSASRAIAESETIEQSGEELEKNFDPSQDFTFSVLFDTMPTLTWTTPYKNLEVTVNAMHNDATIKAVADANLRILRKEKGGDLRVVSGRGVQAGDVVIVDFDAAVAETGEVIPGAARQGMKLDTETADVDFLPGVVGAMIGMNAGEEKKTTITFPTSEDFSPAALRGVAAAITVKVSEVFEWILPEADDDWAASIMGPGSTLKDIETRLAENAAAEAEDELQKSIADAFTDAVAAAIDVDVPSALLQEAGQNAYSREITSLINKGVMSYEQAQQLASPQLLANYIDRKKDELINLQKATMGFAEIMEQEGLSPSEAAIQQELQEAIASLERMQGGRGGDVNEAGLRDQVEQTLGTQVVMDWLVANCKVNVNELK